MGEAKRKQSATMRLLQQHPFCCLCGGTQAATTRDHIPPKSLFDNSHRPHGIVVPACQECNNGSSTADLVVSLIARWRFDQETENERKDHRRLALRLRKQAPEIASEWTSLGLVARKRAKRHLREQGVELPSGSVVAIGNHTMPFINLFCHKLVLGLYFDHFQEALSARGGVFATFMTKEDLAANGPPQDLLNLFPKARALIQGVWDTSDQFAYRYDENKEDGLFGCAARLRKGILIVGLAIRDRNLLPESDGADFISPSSLAMHIDDPAFAIRR